MNILFHAYPHNARAWIQCLQQQLPQAHIRLWRPGDHGAADYLITRHPPADLLIDRPDLQAIFNLGAGADSLLQALRDPIATLPQSIPLVRLEDAGMASQMVDYVVHAVLHQYRQFEDYANYRRLRQWHVLSAPRKKNFQVGILGLGILGSAVAVALDSLGFEVRGWSRRAKPEARIPYEYGTQGLPQFLKGLNCLINLLPLTPETENILNRALFQQLAPGAYLINVARGAHLVEADLLEAIQTGTLSGARLDVMRLEPLPADHPFWQEPRISITPHISAVNLLEPSMKQIAQKIRALCRGESISGVIDRHSSY
ncbi:MAG: 2-hydroxyacid dehydrogenase [Burkholderiales bacterium]